jgi:hypothetical protein
VVRACRRGGGRPEQGGGSKRQEERHRYRVEGYRIVPFNGVRLLISVYEISGV